MLPQDSFSSLNDAAHDFAKNYMLLSYALNDEFATTFYEYTDKNGNTAYRYAVPTQGTRYYSEPERAHMKSGFTEEKGYQRVADGHTHGNFATTDNDPFVENETKFSPGDIDVAKNSIYTPMMPSYVFVPNGLGKLFDPNAKEGEQFSIVFGDLPKDLGDLKRNKKRFTYENPENRPIPFYQMYEVPSGYDHKLVNLHHNNVK